MAPEGTRGVRMSGPAKSIIKWFNGLTASRIGRTGKAFGTMPALVLTTVGRKSGMERRTPLAYIPDGRDGWLIIAAYAGAVNNPAWYYNLGAHPDRVRIELDGRTHDVTATERHGPDRDAAWERIVTASKRFANYQDKTDRELHVRAVDPSLGSDSQGRLRRRGLRRRLWWRLDSDPSDVQFRRRISLLPGSTWALPGPPERADPGRGAATGSPRRSRAPRRSARHLALARPVPAAR